MANLRCKGAHQDGISIIGEETIDGGWDLRGHCLLLVGRVPGHGSAI